MDRSAGFVTPGDHVKDIFAFGKISNTWFAFAIVLIAAPRNKIFFDCNFGFINKAAHTLSPLAIKFISLFLNNCLRANTFAFAIIRSMHKGFDKISFPGMLRLDVFDLHINNLEINTSVTLVFLPINFHSVSISFFCLLLSTI